MAVSKARVDKWLWCVRIFKSRTIATDTCKGGKVKVQGETVKPSYLLHEGQIVVVRKNGFDFQFKVINLLQNRVSAPLAALSYENLTPAEELNKYNDWFSGKGAIERRDRGTGRPTKRERRDIDRFKDDDAYFDEDWSED
ncbi:MAG: RNA-binding S4 domain-containing protein [Saprospiraceae bacterium]|nr:RNA-binding S4 domain-containing protein [Saprospiraceae bacterium]MDZ4704009.1 RNA-binding S4 domain-containing protein [Saprospiraceae bacterium]